ncbi:MAG TPA: TMEM165/GDT1 family protein [Dermatophilaceae bacterium]|nr:TMEM165/GDT1 family protein [Dermatophilaceae bacterium]
MTFSLVAAATALALIVPVELPDKTFVATLVLATRFRPLLVWIGVVSAFAVQTTVAVVAGSLLTALPRTPVQIASMLLFVVGGVLLLRGASRADAEEAEAEEEFGEVAASKGAATGLKAIATSFLVLFLAEWGDLSQILTANLVAQTGEPLSIGLGAFLGLALVSGLGATLGHQLLRRVSLSTIRRIGGGVCLLLALLSLLGLLGVDVPVLG